MKVEEIKEIARRMGLQVSKMKKGDMIRSIQRAEGNPECFGAGQVSTCGQMNCLWRQDCV